MPSLSAQCVRLRVLNHALSRAESGVNQALANVLQSQEELRQAIIRRDLLTDVARNELVAAIGERE
jgi:hypothetical protein